MEEMNTEVQAAPKRPTFLTVLCIITWVGCGLAIIGAVYNYFTAQSSYENMQNLGDVYGGTGMMDDMMDAARMAAENAGINLAIGLSAAVLCLVGSIMMWNLKKTGFYIYSVGEIAPIVSAFVLSGGGKFAIIGALVGGIIAIAWVIMYAVNLKHMK